MFKKYILLLTATLLIVVYYRNYVNADVVSGSLRNEQINILELEKDKETYYLNNKKRNIKIIDAKNKAINSVEEISKLTPISTTNLNDADFKQNLKLMSSVARIYDYFSDNFNYKGIDNNNKTIYLLVNYPTNYNAFATNDYIVFSPNFKDAYEKIDIVGQEYAHLVFGNVTHMTSGNEQNSINEGFAITMGLLINNYYNKNHNISDENFWTYNNNVSFFNPPKFNGAIQVGDKNYDFTDLEKLNKENKYYKIYGNATVYGHIIYNIAKNSNIDLVNLTKLMFQSCVTLSSKEIGKNNVYTYNWYNIRYAFEKCAETLKCSDSVKTAVKEAFDKANIKQAIKPLPYSYKVNADKTITITGYTNELSKTLNIPDKIEGMPVTSITSSAFLNAYNLENVILSDNIKEIGDNCFYNCINLKSIKLTNSITKLNRGVFGDCKQLTDVIISNTVTVIDAVAFGGCISLKNIDLPKNVNKIGYYAFGNCTSLEIIKIPKSVTHIDEGAFYNLPNIKILSNSGSTAESFAKKYNLKFEVVK